MHAERLAFKPFCPVFMRGTRGGGLGAGFPTLVGSDFSQGKVFNSVHTRKMKDRADALDVIAGNQAAWPVNGEKGAFFLHFLGAEIAFALFDLVFIILDERPVAHEMNLEIDAVTFIGITPTPENRRVAFGIRAE